MILKLNIKINTAVESWRSNQCIDSCKVENNDIKWNIIVVIVVVVNIIIDNTTDQERDCKTKAKEKVNPKWKSFISVKPFYYEFVQVLTTIGLPVVSIGSNNVQTVHNKDIKP